mgnify:CR=1 FL=1
MMSEETGKKVKPINVVTSAIPRGTVGHCLKSFLNAMADRDDYYLRWICHLDKYPGMRNINESLRQIACVHPLFDSFCLLIPMGNVGFGMSVKLCLELTQHDTLWIEDDWDWTGKTFRMADVEAATTDCFSFVTPDTKAGAMHPTFWRRHVLDYWLKNFPRNRQTATETTMFNLLKRRFKMDGIKLLSLDEDHIGDKVMVEMGFEHNWNGQRLLAKRHRPKWDSEKEDWVKQ